jgi:hypothetical protein
MVRMGSPVRFRRGAPPQHTGQAGSSTRPVACLERREPAFARDLPETTVRARQNTWRGTQFGLALRVSSAVATTTASRAWIAAATRAAISGVVWR